MFSTDLNTLNVELQCKTSSDANDLPLFKYIKCWTSMILLFCELDEMRNLNTLNVELQSCSSKSLPHLDRI